MIPSGKTRAAWPKVMALGIAALLCALPGRLTAQQSTGVEAKSDPDNFITLYPGVYTAREAEPVARYLADNEALKRRGPIDVRALVSGTLPKDTPGIGTVVHVTEDMVRYTNRKYDPENPLRNDSAYARRLGFQDILAYPTFGTHDDTFMVPYPPAARDTLLVSDLNHSVTSYRPIYPGDTLYLVANEREMVDLTPTEGSVYRSVALQTKGSVYNQRGEKVNDVIFRVTEGIKIYKEGRGPINPTFAQVWEAPNWRSRPEHVYTDQDWAAIRRIWTQEKRRGPESRYWEDVKVGDTPEWTLDGPIEASVLPIAPWGNGLGGSRTLKRDILDPEIFKTLVRSGADGIYRTPDRADQVPPVPPGAEGATSTVTDPAAGAIESANIHKEKDGRSALVNYMGRDFAIRHLSNWMGDAGWLENIRWSIMDPRAHAAYGKTVVSNPRAEHYLDRVPFMKGRFVQAHGLTHDVAIVKSYVYGKSVRDGQFLVDLVWWIETIDGTIWEEGGATVRLPSRRVH